MVAAVTTCEPARYLVAITDTKTIELILGGRA